MDKERQKPKRVPESRADPNLSDLVYEGGKKIDYSTGKKYERGEDIPLPGERVLYKDRIVSNPEILVGKPTIKGTRLSVEAVLGYLAGNLDFNDLKEAFPRLTDEDLKACLGYAQALVAGDLKQLRRYKRRGIPFFE